MCSWINHTGEGFLITIPYDVGPFYYNCQSPYNKETLVALVIVTTEYMSVKMCYYRHCELLSTETYK